MELIVVSPGGQGRLYHRPFSLITKPIRSTQMSTASKKLNHQIRICRAWIKDQCIGDLDQRLARNPSFNRDVYRISLFVAAASPTR